MLNAHKVIKLSENRVKLLYIQGKAPVNHVIKLLFCNLARGFVGFAAFLPLALQGYTVGFGVIYPYSEFFSWVCAVFVFVIATEAQAVKIHTADAILAVFRVLVKLDNRIQTALDYL
jgi:hypothetical protein